MLFCLCKDRQGLAIDHCLELVLELILQFFPLESVLGVADGKSFQMQLPKNTLVSAVVGLPKILSGR